VLLAQEKSRLEMLLLMLLELSLLFFIWLRKSIGSGLFICGKIGLLWLLSFIIWSIWFIFSKAIAMNDSTFLSNALGINSVWVLSHTFCRLLTCKADASSSFSITISDNLSSYNFKLFFINFSFSRGVYKLINSCFLKP
jgi:hypothetical protein